MMKEEFRYLDVENTTITGFSVLVFTIFFCQIHKTKQLLTTHHVFKHRRVGREICGLKIGCAI